MLTGKRAYPPTDLQSLQPPVLERLVKTCFAKDPDARWQSAHDVKVGLEWIGESRATAEAAGTSERRRIERTAWIVAAGFLGVSLVLAGLYWMARSSRRVQLNVRVTLSAGKGAFGVIPEWVQGVAAGQMDESWINKHGQLDSKGGPWQNAFPKSRSLAGAKQV